VPAELLEAVQPAACRTCSAPARSPGLDVCVSCLCAELGITYRMLDYWCRAGYLNPGRAERGRFRSSGSPRVWTAEELRVARLMGRLVGASLSPEVAAIVARNGWQRSQIGPGIWLEIDPGIPLQEGNEP
jgi:hypothetical protein